MRVERGQVSTAGLVSKPEGGGQRHGPGTGGWLFLVVSALLWAMSYGWVLYWRHHGFAANSDRASLLINDKRLRDVTFFALPFRYWHTAEFYMLGGQPNLSYPAAAAVLLLFFFLFKHWLVAFEVVSYAGPMLVGGVFAWALVRRGMRAWIAFGFVALTLLMSYPFWFEWQAGNIEVVLFLLTAAGVAAFWKRWYWLAAVLIGIVGAAKLYPLMLLGLLFARKKYWQTAAGVASALLTNYLSLMILGPTVTVARQGIATGLDWFRRTYLLIERDMRWDHSLLAMVKLLANQPGDPHDRYVTLVPVYVATMAVLGLLLYWFRIRHLPRVNQIVALVTLSVLIPPISYDYTLVHLYIAWAALVLYVVETRNRSLPVLWTFGLFAFVMSSEGSVYFDSVRIAAQLKCLALVAIVAIALRVPLPMQEDDASILSERESSLLPLPEVC